MSSCNLGYKRAPNNIGHSSRLPYDQCAYEDRLSESVSPLLYKVNPNQIKNCKSCLSTLGPRSSYMGYGVSTTVGNTTAQSQDLVDVESILSNRNVTASACKNGKVNEIDVTRFRLQHARTCNDFLDPMASRLSTPAANYRGMSINRFYDLPINPQDPKNIFWNYAVNSKLEAKDNFRDRIPRLMNQGAVIPRPLKGTVKQPHYVVRNRCPDGTC